MKWARQVCFWAGLLCLVPVGAQGRVFAWDDYGPACQWIRLKGELERPPNMDGVVLLTVSYKFPDQKTPATLLTNYPISNSRFHFVLSGFRENIQGVIFVPPMFFFSESIEFQYFVSLPGGRRVSEYGSSVYHPQRIKKDGQVLCQTEIQLGSLTLSQR